MSSRYGLPDDETLVMEGVVTASQPVGGGHAFAPPGVQVVVDGRAVTVDRAPCGECGPLPDHQRSTGWSVGSTVVVSTVHGHYVVREVSA